MLRQGESTRRRLVTTLAGAALALGLIGASPATAGAGPRIVGGSPTTIEAWPWQVAIVSEGSGSGFDRQFCGGSLVAPNIVLSAAHCFHDVLDPSPDGDFDDPAPYSIVTGRTTLSSTQGREIEVVDIVVPVDSAVGPFLESARTSPPSGPDLYNPGTSEWDAVFLRLALDSTSEAIKIAGPAETALWEPGKTAWVTGWGNRAPGGVGNDFPDDLHEAQIHMISDAFCGGLTSYGSQFIPETMVCAGETAGGKDTCQGDSGGPLVVPVDATGDFRLVGDTSFGRGCALPNFPGVYGRIAADPMRSAFACGIQREAGANVLGAGAFPSCPTPPPGGVDPGTPADPGAPAQPVTPAPPASSDDCDEARDKLKAAKKKLKRAKSELKDAKRDNASEKTIDRAKNKVKKAKKKVRKAKQRVEEVC